MNLAQNLFIAKKLLSELIYNHAYVEGCNVTFPQAETILEGMKVSNVSVNDIQTVINLRDAYRFVLGQIEEAGGPVIDLDYICEVHSNVSRNEAIAWGSLRTGRVGVSGTTYEPPIPEEGEVIEYLKNINEIDNPLERAVTYFISSTKRQLFWDGNKRVAIIVANAILISNGCGVFSINEDNTERYNELLKSFYDSDETGMDLEEPISEEFSVFIKDQIEASIARFSFNVEMKI